MEGIENRNRKLILEQCVSVIKLQDKVVFYEGTRDTTALIML